MREDNPDGLRRDDEGRVSSSSEKPAAGGQSYPGVTGQRLGGRSAPPWVRLTGAGLELAVFAIAIGGLGALIDRGLGNDRPLGLAFGGLVGFALGMVRFIRIASRASKSQREQEHDSTRPAQRNDNTP